MKYKASYTFLVIVSVNHHLAFQVIFVLFQ